MELIDLLTTCPRCGYRCAAAPWRCPVCRPGDYGRLQTRVVRLKEQLASDSLSARKRGSLEQRLLSCELREVAVLAAGSPVLDDALLQEVRGRVDIDALARIRRISRRRTFHSLVRAALGDRTEPADVQRLSAAWKALKLFDTFERTRPDLVQAVRANAIFNGHLHPLEIPSRLPFHPGEALMYVTDTQMVRFGTREREISASANTIPFGSFITLSGAVTSTDRISTASGMLTDQARGRCEITTHRVGFVPEGLARSWHVSLEALAEPRLWHGLTLIDNSDEVRGLALGIEAMTALEVVRQWRLNALRATASDLG
jgi:hypothetical protein